ncbi:unnamed protein product, partial [Mesorhabditis belari]|uniref:17S U2 SnRNP complex component HTATSF1 n=1 Tax=Mesorhabditis belari TaxID=2138241 RepID=A0AAF3FE60_9BILA
MADVNTTGSEVATVSETKAPESTEPAPAPFPENADKDFEQRYINDKWVIRYANGGFAKLEDDEWKYLDEGEGELMQQLWFEQIAAETQIIDGVKHVWDREKQEWQRVQEIDEDFIANYQANYGVDYDYSKIEVKKPDNVKPQEKEKNEQKKDKNKIPQKGWVDNELNTSVYVTNLPPDIDEEEFHEFMIKCGVVQMDPRSNKPKIKLYRNQDGSLKGDGRCTYVKQESVELATTLLHESMFKGSKISVEEAHFEMKGDYDPAKKKRRLTAQQKKRFLDQQNKIFAWTPDKPRSYRPKSDCVVILKGLFTIEEMEANAALMLDLKEELSKSCAKYGPVKKVVVYDNNPEGVASVHFSNTEHSDLAVKSLNNRVVDGRLIQAHLWDGRTKYKVEESEEEAKKRLEKYGQSLEANEESEDTSDEHESDSHEEAEAKTDDDDGEEEREEGQQDVASSQ